MNPIEQKAIKSFQTNLIYFAKEHPKVYEKINILNQAIENGSYIEKYSLEYKNEYFDVLELASNHFLYNQNSIEYSKLLTKQTNLKKSDNVIESFYNLNINEKDVKRYDQKPPILDSLFASAKIIHYTNNIASKNDDMKHIYKFIFCGTGLGLHLSEIMNKINASQLLIIEDNLELFRLSCFTTDYQSLSHKRKLSFSIMEDDTEFKKSFQDFFMHGYNNNQYLKYATFSQSDISKIKRIQNFIVTSDYLTFSYANILKELLKSPEYLVEKYPFINVSEMHSTMPLTDKPVLIIASGPSLERNAKWLQENKNKFFIISVLSSVKTLYKLKVKPDIVVHIDTLSVSINLFDDINLKTFFDKTVFLFSSVVSTNVVNSFNKKNIYFFETVSNYKQDFGSLVAPSVGETTYALSLILGFKELYLLGLDLALDSETKSTHSKEHMSSRNIVHSIDQDESYTSVRDTISYIKGNFLLEVPITPIYRTSVIAFNNFSNKYLTKGQKVYNLSNGAYFNKTIPLNANDIDIERFSTLMPTDKFTTAKSFFNKISENTLNDKDLQNLDKQIEEAKRLQIYIKDFSKNVKINNYETYMQKYYQLSSELINRSNPNTFSINYIMFNYLQYVSGYIFDMFNTKNLKNTKRHLKKINTIFLEQLNKILDLYLASMKVYQKYALEGKD